MGKFKRDAERCPVTWNPGEWPYATRCNLRARHGKKTHDPVHIDHRGRRFNGVTGAMSNPPEAEQEAHVKEAKE